MEVNDIVTWVGMAGGLAGVWFRTQFKIERLEEKNGEQARQTEAIWKWKDDHAKESLGIRDKINADISELRGASLVTNEQFKQIMQTLQDIKKKVEQLENGG